MTRCPRMAWRNLPCRKTVCLTILCIGCAKGKAGTRRPFALQRCTETSVSIRHGRCARFNPFRDYPSGSRFTLGGIGLLTGCNLSDDPSVECFLYGVSRWNDRVQGAIFHPERLADTYTEAQITRRFPFNAFYRTRSISIHECPRAQYARHLS
jgi:hypothetical protein